MLGPALPVLAADTQWVEVRSPHFSVITDAGDKRGRQAALRFEQMRMAFGTLLGRSKVTTPTPLQIIAFRSTKEMRQFVPIWKGKPIELAGLFQGGEDRCFILLDMSVEDPWRVVFHEYGHQLQNGNISFRAQPWFDEGFAEFFSTIQATGNNVDVGRPSEGNAEVLRQNRFMKISDLFQVQQQSSTYNESGERRSIFYAESWLVVHYIFDKHLMPQLVAYFNLLLNQRKPVDEAIQTAFGMPSAALDKAIERYFNENNYVYYPVPMPVNFDGSSYSVKPLQALDVKASLADVHLHSSDYAESAMQDFQEILKQQPDNQAALRGLGYAYMRKRDYKQAGEYFDKAAQADSNDPRVLYYSAVLAQQEGGLNSDPGKLAKLQKQLEKAIVLDPEFADAYSVLSFVLMTEGKPDEAVSAMTKAVSLNPRNEQYSLFLAQLYLMQHKHDDAIAIFQQLSKSPMPPTAMAAERLLENAQSMKEMAAAGRDVRFSARAGVSPERQEQTPATTAPTAATTVPVLFIKGKVVSVDCSDPKAAELNLAVGTTNWKLHVNDRAHTLLLGAETFSCNWTNQKVAVNFRKTGETNGDVVSLELQ